MLVKTGRFDAALQILRPLAEEHPDQIDVLFLIGLAAVEASRRQDDEEEQKALLDEAIAALRAILIERPELVRVRLELARAFFLRGDDSLSRDHFERVLSGQPAPGVAANIQRFLLTMRARRRWTAHFGIAIAPDSNLSTPPRRSRPSMSTASRSSATPPKRQQVSAPSSGAAEHTNIP